MVERGRAPIDDRAVEALAQVLDVTLGYFTPSHLSHIVDVIERLPGGVRPPRTRRLSA